MKEHDVTADGRISYEEFKKRSEEHTSELQ